MYNRRTPNIPRPEPMPPRPGQIPGPMPQRPYPRPEDRYPPYNPRYPYPYNPRYPYQYPVYPPIYNPYPVPIVNPAPIIITPPVVVGNWRLLPQQDPNFVRAIDATKYYVATTFGPEAEFDIIDVQYQVVNGINYSINTYVYFGNTVRRVSFRVNDNMGRITVIA